MLAGQVMLGACTSFTVMRKEQVRVLFDASVALQTTVVMPFGKAEPDTNPLWMDTEPPGQLSVKVGVVYVETAVQRSRSVVLVWLDGQLMVGRSLSLTVIVNVHRVVRPTASMACQVTELTPLSKTVPLAPPLIKDCDTPGQLSEDVGGV